MTCFNTCSLKPQELRVSIPQLDYTTPLQILRTSYSNIQKYCNNKLQIRRIKFQVCQTWYILMDAVMPQGINSDLVFTFRSTQRYSCKYYSINTTSSIPPSNLTANNKKNTRRHKQEHNRQSPKMSWSYLTRNVIHFLIKHCWSLGIAISNVVG